MNSPFNKSRERQLGDEKFHFLLPGLRSRFEFARIRIRPSGIKKNRSGFGSDHQRPNSNSTLKKTTRIRPNKYNLDMLVENNNFGEQILQEKWRGLEEF